MTTARPRGPVEGPLVQWWHPPLLFVLLVPLGSFLGSVSGNSDLPLPARAGAGLAIWLIPMAGLILLRPWLRRLDEFQKQIVWKGAAQAGIGAVLFFAFLPFYFTLIGPGLHGPYPMIGSAPGACMTVAVVMIRGLEQKARRATAGARE